MIDTLSVNESLLRFDYDKFNPYLYHFKDVDWSIWGTLTWNDETCRKEDARAEWLRQRAFHQLLFAASRHFRIRGKSLAYYRSMEFGEGECHYHFMIARDGIERIPSIELAACLKDLWQSKLQTIGSTKQGIGRADVQPYDKQQGLAGVFYFVKRERDANGNERERFDCPSGALIKLLQRKTELLQAA